MPQATLDYCRRPARRGTQHFLVWLCVFFTILSTPGLIFVVAYSNAARSLFGPVNEAVLSWIVLSLPAISFALNLCALQVMRSLRQEQDAPRAMRFMVLSVGISAIWIVWGILAWGAMQSWSGFSPG